MAGKVFACTVQFPTFFLRVCQVFRTYLPCYTKVEHYNVLTAPQSAGLWCEIFIFWSIFTALGNLLPGVSNVWLSSGTLGLSRPFLHHLVSYTSYNREMTHSEPDNIENRWQLNGDLFFYGCCFSFHDRPNNLFALAAFNGGSSYQIWGICHIFQESK